MRKLLNTLFITSEDVYLSLDGENIVAHREKQEIARYPLHTLQNIISFSYAGASPSLMGACAERNISLSFCTPRGKFLVRVCGKFNGNVLLRREQYRRADDESASCFISRSMIFSKVYNSRWSIERTIRTHKLAVDADTLSRTSEHLKNLLPLIASSTKLDNLRGLEGAAATAYFNNFNQLILYDKSFFAFKGRTRRPPLDPINALLSFTYNLLVNDCASALESVGLDSYVGFFHQDKPGRTSLALDLVEEFRSCFADRFVLSQVNNRVFDRKDFIFRESGGVYLTDDARKKFLQHWQERKKEIITHPFLNEKIPWGLVPYIQSLLLARFLRADLEEYPSFLWK